MSSEPLEPDSIEYMDAPGRPATTYSAIPQNVVYQSDGLPCCSGCGCLLLCLSAVLVFNLGSVLTGILVVATAAVLSGAVLRMAGVKRFSPYYAFLLVPVFLLLMNVLGRVVRGTYAFTFTEVAGATLLVYIFLYAARGIGRR